MRVGFYWGEISDNCPPLLAAYHKDITPGGLAALRGYWRGQNKWEHEQIKKSSKPGKTKEETDEDEKRRERYKGKG